jgi:hypothetical protein
MKMARAFGATDAFGDADARLVDRYGPNLRACGDESKTGQRVTRIFDPDFLVRPLQDTDNDIDGLLRARSDYDLFGLATNRACGPQVVSNGLAQFEHAAWIGIAEVMSSKGAQRADAEFSPQLGGARIHQRTPRLKGRSSLCVVTSTKPPGFRGDAAVLATDTGRFLWW